jgi:hypothetical protein
MSTTARLEDLKRDLARLERKWTGPRHDSLGAEGDRGREAGHPPSKSPLVAGSTFCGAPGVRLERPTCFSSRAA